MRERRGPWSVLAIVAVSIVLAACGGSDTPTPDGGGGGGNGGGDGNGGGGGGNGGGGGGTAGANSFTFRITGDHAASGTYALTPGAATFLQTGWVVFYADESESTIIQINTSTETPLINYGSPDITIGAHEELGCSIDFSQNDEDGLAGSFACDDTLGVTQAGEQLTVDFSGAFDAHP